MGKQKRKQSLEAGLYGGEVYHARNLDHSKETMVNIACPNGPSGSGSVVEHLLAKEGVASSNLVFRSIFFGDVAQWLRRGSAKPLSPVRVRPAPPERHAGSPAAGACLACGTGCSSCLKRSSSSR